MKNCCLLSVACFRTLKDFTTVGPCVADGFLLNSDPVGVKVEQNSDEKPVVGLIFLPWDVDTKLGIGFGGEGGVVAVTVDGKDSLVEGVLTFVMP